MSNKFQIRKFNLQISFETARQMALSMFDFLDFGITICLLFVFLSFVILNGPKDATAIGTIHAERPPFFRRIITVSYFF